MARTKGSKNKMTIAIKDAVERCFGQVNVNNEYLLDLAKNEKALFNQLIIRCIPAAVAVDVSVNLVSLSAAMESAAARLEPTNNKPMIDITPKTPKPLKVKEKE